VDKFSKGQSNFEIVLASQKCVFGKAGLDFNPHNKKRPVSKAFSSFFEKTTDYFVETTDCLVETTDCLVETTNCFVFLLHEEGSFC